MPSIDLNLLIALDALLQAGSVAGAARRLGLSASAMSHTLARLRAATGDPLLVRAGRGLVATPHAMALRDRVRTLTTEVQAVLRPGTAGFDLVSLDRVFTLRANEGFVEAFAMRIVTAVTARAPGVRLCFAPKPDKDVRALREGLVDLDIGVQGETGPEVRLQALYRDHFVGAVRRGHALMAGPIDPQRFAACDHVITARHGITAGPVDDALAALGLTRRIAVAVPTFPAALALARTSDLVALVPNAYIEGQRDRDAFESFPLPVETPPISIVQMWHPRMDADPAHRWLRGLVRTVCRAARPEEGAPDA